MASDIRSERGTVSLKDVEEFDPAERRNKPDGKPGKAALVLGPGISQELAEKFITAFFFLDADITSFFVDQDDSLLPIDGQVTTEKALRQGDKPQQVFVLPEEKAKEFDICYTVNLIAGSFQYIVYSPESTEWMLDGGPL